jgi:hypothetical protein
VASSTTKTLNIHIEAGMPISLTKKENQTYSLYIIHPPLKNKCHYNYELSPVRVIGVAIGSENIDYYIDQS